VTEIEPNSFFVTNTKRTDAPDESKDKDRINPASGRVSNQKMLPGVYEKLNQSHKEQEE
jgi:hypothetical protein